MAYKDKLPILKNFVEMGITQDVSSVDTTIYVSNASLFPSVVPGADYIPCVIRWSGSTREVVHVTAVNTSANTITVERGQEGTAAQSWPIGSFIYATLTAQAQADLLNNIWIRCRQSDGNAVAITVESATSFSLPGDWTDSLEPMMALRILANDAFLATENGIYIDSVSYTASTGKTLVGIRGVTLPATIAAVEHSLSSRAVSQSKEVQAYRDLVERVSANLNESERICTEKAQIAQAAADRLTLSSAVDSTRNDCAATPLAVKTAYDAAKSKLPLAGGVLSGSIQINGTSNVTSAAPAVDSDKGLFFADKNGANMGGVDLIQLAKDNSKLAQLFAKNSSGEYISFAVNIREDGTGEASVNRPLHIDGDLFVNGAVHGKSDTAGHADSANTANYANSAGSAPANGGTAWAANRLRREGGVDTVWNWAGQGGQPGWLWGGNDGTNMYVYNPANFSVNYANSAYISTAVSGVWFGRNNQTVPSGGTWRVITSINGKIDFMTVAGGTSIPHDWWYAVRVA
ncbi:phage tail protein [Bilophila wadsworthia]|uniref:phage tail protein n=1 Tax=Bilophila wadsworthia TaxID=35833 RepID=UPI00352103AF